MLKRTTEINIGEKLSIDQECKKLIKCIKSRNLISQDVLLRDSSSLDEKFESEDSLMK